MRRTNQPTHGAHGAASPHGQTTRYVPAAQAARHRLAGWGGFAAGIVGYLLLSYQQPAGWGEGLWAGLALLLVPALVGFVVNRVQGQDRQPRRAFFAGMKSAGLAMFFYAFITVTVLAHRLGVSGDGGAEVLAGLLVTVVYTLLAGLIAGLVNLALTRIATNRRMVKPAATFGRGSATDLGEDKHGPAS